MADKKKNVKKQIGEKTMKLQDLKDFTIGEIVEKSKRVAQENLQSESVLDKYIRQHRSEIEKAKNNELDHYLHAERQKIIADSKHKEASDFAANSPKQDEIKEISEKDPAPNVAVSETVELSAQDQALSDKKLQAVQHSDSEKRSETDQEHLAEASSEHLSEISDTAVKKEKEPAEDVNGSLKLSDEISQNEKVDTTASEVSKDEEQQIQKNKASFDRVEIADETAPVVQQGLGKSGSSEKQSSANLLEAQKTAEETLPAALEKEGNSDKITAVKKKHKVPIVIGLCAILLLAAGMTYLATQDNQKSRPIHTAQSDKKQKKESAVEKFNTDYAKFFVNSAETQLKNSEFANLAVLKKDETAITVKTALENAKSQYKQLETQINAIQKVNELFTSAAIVDGNLKSGATIKSGISLFTTPNTSNETLNTLLAQAMKLAITQQNAQTSSSSSEHTSTSTQKSAATTNAANTTTASKAAVTLENSVARIQPQAGINKESSAFTWATGVEEEILNECRARGYFTGNDYILVPVAIHTTNGKEGPAGIVSGYYNLYRSDGTYLVSINCKTGYFVGNGAGHASALDY